MASIIYEKNGIYIEYNDKGAVFKKNGLTIEIPGEVLMDFEQEFEQAKIDYAKELRQPQERSEP